MHITLMGRRWRVIENSTELPRNWDGSCDPPKKKNKTIHIRGKLSEERYLEVLLHEMMHAIDEHRDEAAITEAARDMARALIRCGFRRGSKSTAKP